MYTCDVVDGDFLIMEICFLVVMIEQTVRRF